MRIASLLALLLPLLSLGQYSGGVGRGDDAEAQALPPAPLFTGGVGRGDAQLGVVLPAAPLFKGGSGRGDALEALVLPSAPLFQGGLGRGDAVDGVTFPVPPMFVGSSGRGDAMMAYLLPPVSPDLMYHGGLGRGDVRATFSAPLFDCAGVVNGMSGPGSSCDDGDPFTANDVYSTACLCAGTYAAVAVAPRVMLEGPYYPATGLMKDSLRANGFIPLTEPYTDLGYSYSTGSSGYAISPAVLATTGGNAIVDWMVVELRSATDVEVVEVSCPALVQRDGDVVALDGASALLLPAVPGNYHVAVRHRNHLGVMTAAPVALGVATTAIDITSSATATYAIDDRKDVNGTMVLWMGDVTFDGVVKYTGASNDRDPILVRIGGSTPTNFVNGYLPEDVNLDGTVKYTGTANDRDPILLNIGGSTPTNTRADGLP